MSRALLFFWMAPGRHCCGVQESSLHKFSLLTLPQELLESRLKVLKNDLEDYEVFRCTEEKESKELLVSPPPPNNRGPPATLTLFWCAVLECVPVE